MVKERKPITPAAIKAYLQRVCEKIAWEKYKNHFIVSDPGINRTAILDLTGERVYDVDTVEDAKRWIDESG